MDCAQIKRRPLCNINVDVIHAFDEMAESGGKGSLQIDFSSQRRRVHEACDDSHAFDSLEANSPVRMQENFLQDFPEHVAADGQGDAVKQQGNAHLRDMRVFGVAQFPQTASIHVIHDF